MRRPFSLPLSLAAGALVAGLFAGPGARADGPPGTVPDFTAVCARARAGAIAMPELVAGLVAIAFAMQWREGARELAAVVGERAHAEQTEVTARPVTLVAQSLMLDTPTLAWVRPPPAPPRERAPSVLDVISGVEPRVLAVLAWSAVAGMFAGILLP